METKLKPEAKKRLERYHQALLQEDGTVEHELATLIHAFLNGYFGEPYLPIREEEQHRIAEGDRHYDVLTTAISSYLFRHDYDMEDKDFVALEEASDALAFYTYQNEANPRKAISAFLHGSIRNLQTMKINHPTLKPALLISLLISRRSSSATSRLA